MSKEKKKILIVEDETSLRKALSDKLVRSGFEVYEAEDGEEGLEKALKEHPDLIILDIIMPKTDGETMMAELRKDSWGKSAHVIVLTNLTDEAKLARMMDRDVFEYFIKSDIKINEVIEKVEELLESPEE